MTHPSYIHTYITTILALCWSGLVSRSFGDSCCLHIEGELTKLWRRAAVITWLSIHAVRGQKCQLLKSRNCNYCVGLLFSPLDLLMERARFSETSVNQSTTIISPLFYSYFPFPLPPLHEMKYQLVRTLRSSEHRSRSRSRASGFESGHGDILRGFSGSLQTNADTVLR
jgi:hypothetical protein